MYFWQNINNITAIIYKADDIIDFRRPGISFRDICKSFHFDDSMILMIE